MLLLSTANAHSPASAHRKASKRRLITLPLPHPLQVHLLVVTAQDGASDPRLSTATVTVLVSDMGDELPVFPQRVYEASVAENQANALLTVVNATDPDSVPAVSVPSCSFLSYTDDDLLIIN